MSAKKALVESLHQEKAGLRSELDELRLAVESAGNVRLKSMRSVSLIHALLRAYRRRMRRAFRRWGESTKSAPIRSRSAWSMHHLAETAVSIQPCQLRRAGRDEGAVLRRIAMNIRESIREELFHPSTGSLNHATASAHAMAVDRSHLRNGSMKSHFRIRRRSLSHIAIEAMPIDDEFER